MVIYHAHCLDGMGAAYAAWLKFGDAAEYVPATYGQEPPDVSGKDVYILDFSYPRDVLLAMMEKANCVVVIDHHKTAQQALSDLEFAIFDIEQSGCVLAWKYFFPGNPAPCALIYIEDRDLWQFKWEDTKDFCTGLRATIKDDFKHIGECDADEMIALGEKLNAEFENQVDALLKIAHELTIDGLTGLAVNANGMFASELGNRLALKSERDSFGVTYYYDGNIKMWKYSLRSIDTGPDISIIAKKYGGGGHRNAAGFVSATLLS